MAVALCSWFGVQTRTFAVLVSQVSEFNVNEPLPRPTLATRSRSLFVCQRHTSTIAVV